MKTNKGRWLTYDGAYFYAWRVRGLRKADSVRAAKNDGGAGVVKVPETGTRVFWQD